MNNNFIPPKKIALESKVNLVFLFLKLRNKILSQICTHFQTKRVESQN